MNRALCWVGNKRRFTRFPICGTWLILVSVCRSSIAAFLLYCPISVTFSSPKRFSSSDGWFSCSAITAFSKGAAVALRDGRRTHAVTVGGSSSPGKRALFFTSQVRVCVRRGGKEGKIVGKKNAKVCSCFETN